MAKKDKAALAKRNAQLSSSPEWQKAIRDVGADPTRLGIPGGTTLTQAQRRRLERQFAPGKGMESGDTGLIRYQTPHKGKILKGALIGGAALTGLGAAGIGPLSGLFGGAAATAGGVGAAAPGVGAAVPSAAEILGVSALPGAAGALGPGALAAGIPELGGALASTAISPSTTGLFGAPSTAGGTDVARRTGLLGKVNNALDSPLGQFVGRVGSRALEGAFAPQPRVPVRQTTTTRRQLDPALMASLGNRLNSAYQGVQNRNTQIQSPDELSHLFDNLDLAGIKL